MSAEMTSPWNIYVVDVAGRRLTGPLVGPSADFLHPDSPGSLALEALPAAAGMELEHAPTGIRIIVPHLSALPLEDLYRFSQLPDVLRAAAGFVDPPRRGPRRDPEFGGGELRFRVAMMWLRTGKPPLQEAVAIELAADLDRPDGIDASTLSRAVRSPYSVRGGKGWDNQLAAAAGFIRHLRAKLPPPAADESELVRRQRELLDGADLTGF